MPIIILENEQAARDKNYYSNYIFARDENISPDGIDITMVNTIESRDQNLPREELPVEIAVCPDKNKDTVYLFVDKLKNKEKILKKIKKLYGKNKS